MMNFREGEFDWFMGGFPSWDEWVAAGSPKYQSQRSPQEARLLHGMMPNAFPQVPSDEEIQQQDQQRAGLLKQKIFMRGLMNNAR